MLNKWAIKKMGEVCNSDLGKTLNQTKDEGELYPYLCAINVLWDKIDLSTLKQTKFKEKEIERYSVRKGDLLICEGGDIGRAAIWDKDETILYQNALHRVRFTDEVLPRFCLLYLRYLKENGVLDSRYGKGVTIKHLVKSSLLSIPIPIPPVEEQSRIVEELDQLSYIIEKKRQQLSELDNLAQSIFYDMFGDPDNSIYEVVRLADLAKNKMSYGSGASAIQYNGNIRYIRITDIKEDGTLSDEKMSPNVVDDKYMLCEGDILFARSGATVGKTYLYSNKDGMSIYAGYLIRFVANTNIVIPKYIYYYTRTTFYKAFIAASAQAVAQPNINAQQYGNLKVCVPPLSLQQLFAKKVETIEMEKAIIKQSISEIENLYDCRMTFYFN